MSAVLFILLQFAPLRLRCFDSARYSFSTSSDFNLLEWIGRIIVVQLFSSLTYFSTMYVLKECFRCFEADIPVRDPHRHISHLAASYFATRLTFYFLA